MYLVSLHYFLFDSCDRGDVYKCERDFTSTRDINECSCGHRKIFACFINISIKRTAYYINPLYLSSLFLPWCDMVEIVGAAQKRKFDNHRFNFQCARAHACDSGGTNCWRREKMEKKLKFSLSLSFPHQEHARDRGTTRSFSMTTSRIEMARKMATAPKGEIFEVSNFTSLLSLLPSYSLSVKNRWPPATSRARQNNRENKKIELLMPLWRGVHNNWLK